jgi:peptidoglycan hydrolase CwlO-like protein
MPRSSRLLVLAAAVAGILAALPAASVLAPSSAQGSLESRVSAARAHEAAIAAAARRDGRRIAQLKVPIADLQAKEDALQSSLDIQQSILDRLQRRLRADRARLVKLRLALAHDNDVLAAQLRASYETPPPDIVTVLLDAHGFAELLEMVDQLQAIGRQNAGVTARVRATRKAVAKETKGLAIDAQRQRQVTAAVLTERDQVSELRIGLVAREMAYVRARSHKSVRLRGLREQRSKLEQQLARQQARTAAALGVALGGPLAGPPPGPVGSFGPHGGTWGFFQAPGTNYSVGNTPILAARLDRLGQALHLHLIGLSGYRTPEHSVEVGGFANDPHTRGEASDTPGVEGVPEGTLRRFGLTRPFAGAHEADHIQLA